MTIEEAKTQIAAFGAQIQLAVRQFETATGLIVHSVPIGHEGGKAIVAVKVQIK